MRKPAPKSVKDIKEQDVYMGDIPLMTNNGTFIVKKARLDGLGDVLVRLSWFSIMKSGKTD